MYSRMDQVKLVGPDHQLAKNLILERKSEFVTKSVGIIVPIIFM